MHSAGPQTGPAYSPWDTAACHTWSAEKSRGPWPHGLVQWGKWPACRRRGTRAGRARGTFTAYDPRARQRSDAYVGGAAVPCRRQHVAGEHWGSPGEAPGRVTGTELTEMRSLTGRRLGGRKRRCSMVARGHWWSPARSEGSCGTGRTRGEEWAVNLKGRRLGEALTSKGGLRHSSGEVWHAPESSGRWWWAGGRVGVGCSRGRGRREKGGGKKWGTACGSAVILY
jgi:hypothetical protein